MIQEIINLAIKAGKETLKYYHEPQTQLKKDNSPLTKADLASNNIITTYLKTHYKNHAIISEENKNRTPKQYTWIIDPLDGTKEFIKKSNEFTINIALTKDNKPILGVIYAPATNDLYYAQKGKGAYKNNQKIQASKKTNNLTMAISRSHSTNESKLNYKTIIKGSSLKGCIVAEGIADLYPRLGDINEWDICAMDIIIKESGAIITDLNNKEIIYNQNKLINGFLVTNNLIHEKILEELSVFLNQKI